MISITMYSRLWTLRPQEVYKAPWPELATMFRLHARMAGKMDAPGFGPYVCEPPPSPCVRHRGIGPIAEPHRCEACVWSITLAVFDADQGDLHALRTCQGELVGRNVTHLWYSSFSYESKQAARIPLRLLIPLAIPFDARRWSWHEFRAKLIRELRIPANKDQCGGRSHFYFLPAAKPKAEIYTAEHQGQLLHPADYATPIPPRPARPVINWSPPPSPTEAVDMAPLLERVRKRAVGFVAKGEFTKADLLFKLLAGNALADHGDRHGALLVTTGMVAWVLPEQPVSVIAHIFELSLEKMIAAGSRHTPEQVERMIEDGLHNAAAEQARLAKAEADKDKHGTVVKDLRSALKRAREGHTATVV